MKRASLWQDMTVLHQNRLPGRTTSFPFPDEAAALRGERSLSDGYLCLNGVWQFYYAADGVLPKGICQGGEEENVLWDEEVYKRQVLCYTLAHEGYGLLS